MKKLIAKKDFTIDNCTYIIGDEVNVKDISIIKKLNEKGFIEPLNFKELVIIERELKNPIKSYKKEEE
jgi:hypothetical protein